MSSKIDICVPFKPRLDLNRSECHANEFGPTRRECTISVNHSRGCFESRNQPAAGWKLFCQRSGFRNLSFEIKRRLLDRAFILFLF